MDEGEAAGVPGFSDREEVEAWLRTQSRKVSVLIAARAALRVLPLLRWSAAWASIDFAAMTYNILVAPAAASLSVALRREAEAARRIAGRAAAAVAAARAAGFGSAFAADEAIRTANFDANSFVRAETIHDATATIGVADAAVRAAESTTATSLGEAASLATDAYDSSRGAAFAVAFAPEGVDAVNRLTRLDDFATAAHKAVRIAHAAYAADAAAIAQTSSSTAVLGLPLWNGLAAPAWATQSWTRLRDALDPAEGWRVWIDWYEARLRGDPYDEALEECYVLIPEEIWAQGPAAANAEIARRIAELRRTRHAEMLERISALEARLAAANGPSPGGMGHNHPPEPLDEIDPALDVLTSQSADTPDLVASRAAVTRLRAALSAVTGYVGAKLDLFIDEAVKSCGKAAGVAIVAIAGAHYAGWIAELSAVIEAAARWLATFPP